jgi:hypothetical protein
MDRIDSREGFARVNTRDKDKPADRGKKADEQIPPAVHSRRPEKEIEDKVKEHPGDADAKVDLGSDESMDASDPSAAAQPGTGDEPVPSSGFPEKKDR